MNFLLSYQKNIYIYMKLFTIYAVYYTKKIANEKFRARGQFP